MNGAAAAPFSNGIFWEPTSASWNWASETMVIASADSLECQAERASVLCSSWIDGYHRKQIHTRGPHWFFFPSMCSMWLPFQFSQRQNTKQVPIHKQLHDLRVVLFFRMPEILSYASCSLRSFYFLAITFCNNTAELEDNIPCSCCLIKNNTEIPATTYGRIISGTQLCPHVPRRLP